MNIGIIGSGSVGGALGKTWARVGHRIVFGSRHPESSEMRETVRQAGPTAGAGTAQEAAAFGDVVVVSLPWQAAKDVLESLDLEGKTVLDTMNPLKPQLAGLEVGLTNSGAEMVAGWARGASVVKIFNTTGSNNMENPNYGEGAPVMFYCGDDAKAKAVAAELAAGAGFDAVDAGPLVNARLLEPLAMLWIWLAVFGGHGREFAFRLMKR